MDDFVAWFQHNGGVLDTSMMAITDFPGSGRGAVALQDIPVRLLQKNFVQIVCSHVSQENHTIFMLPRSLTLSTQTSSLPSAFGFEEWRKHKLHKGWAGLILCMMWEEAQGNQGKWITYLGRSFQTTTCQFFLNSRYSVTPDAIRHPNILE